ncbi:hypothetical protein AVEN_89255-1 [Araneus ventricosus]|uniref:Uncharacterized protein n=1 Tax=Araneus ventricosus TaxID=182803 RepID=A0A4Y2V5E9_ARAVE|nr:hypothetical protein AVEN_39259-1 [Araneus ventricosus]GBO19771.1 hypothetical protein AVEN_89255-1 [Araneus ventricosus]
MGGYYFYKACCVSEISRLQAHGRTDKQISGFRPKSDSVVQHYNINTTPCPCNYNIWFFKQCRGHEVEEKSQHKDIISSFICAARYTLEKGKQKAVH